MKVVLLNAPPRSGKNTAAEMIRSMHDSCSVIGLSHHLKRMSHGIYLGRKGWDMDPDCFDAIKSEPQEILGGMSWRQAYIHYSEKVIKPLHGAEWFGERFMLAAHDSGSELIAVPDSGFRSEVERVVREVGPQNVTLVRIHKDGCTFIGDSRTYISLADLGVREFDVTNKHSQLGALKLALTDIIYGHVLSPTRLAA